MNINNEAIESLYKSNAVNEDLVIYSGKFCIYTNIPIKCNGVIYYKISEPVSINFEADVYQFDDISDSVDFKSLDNAQLEIVGYKLMDVEIMSIKSGKVRGYVNDIIIKSKDSIVDYVQFDIVNMDKIPGKLVKYKDIVYAGRIQFDINDYTVIIDKSYEYNKELHRDLVSKNGSIITHTGRIYRKNMEPFKTRNIDDMLHRISTALSFCCGRYINIPNAFGFKDETSTYRAWYKMPSTDYRFVFKWTTTISNYHNFEKYMSLMCKKLENIYYNNTIVNIVDWYVEALNGLNMGNNIISIQTALEMLSYVVLVEDESHFTQYEYDSHPANQNIRCLLKRCKIDNKIPDSTCLSKKDLKKFQDGVDLLTYYRNSIVHPSKRKRNIDLGFEEMWNIILLGVNYIELSILYMINYKGEYTDRFKDYCFGDIEIVPWVKLAKK